jgi:hypothetical protein
MRELLLKALDKARSYPGMGSVNLSFDPYDCLWVAVADWSDRTKLIAKDEEPEDALKLLIRFLDDPTSKKGDQTCV